MQPWQDRNCTILQLQTAVKRYLHKAGIEINRKVLADLAVNHPEAFKAVVAKAKVA